MTAAPGHRDDDPVEGLPAAGCLAVACVDGRGRLPLAALGAAWQAGATVSVRAAAMGIVVRQAVPGGRMTLRLDGRCRLFIPLGVRHLAGLEPGSRVVVLATADAKALNVIAAQAAGTAIMRWIHGGLP